MMDEQEAIEHKERHLVSNIVGSKSTHFEVGSPCNMAQRDILILASDGILDNFLEAEMTQLVRQGTIREATENLVNIAQERMHDASNNLPSKPDDIALILFRQHTT